MKKKGLETSLYSIVGVAAVFIIVVAVNLIAARFKTRVDLTAERAYTLSQGTRNILAKLDTPVQIRFYVTQNDNKIPVPLKTYAQRVEDLLGEYRQASKGLIEIQKLDPSPDSDAEDSAKLDGIEGQMISEGEAIYLGLSVTMLDKKEAIPFLTPDRERLLEFDLSRAISRVATADKPVVGIMSPLPFAGASPMMARMGRGGGPPWVFYSELQRDFKVQQVETTAEEIPSDVKVLVVIHPKQLSDATQFAIDQFVLRGGKLLAFLDPQAALDSTAAGPMGMGGGSSSNLDKLLKAWGLDFDSSKVVADTTYLGRTRQGRAPAVLALTETALNKDDIITAQADNLLLAFAGAFTGTPAAGLNETVLIKSSKDSQLVEGFTAQMSGEQVLKDFKPSGIEYALAVRLTGKFKTAFPDGKPKAEPAPGEPKPEEKKDEKKDDKAALKESTGEGVVVLVGDSDFIQDQLTVQEIQNPFGGGQRMVVPTNGNLAFIQGAIEQLSGDDNLIAVRSRASRERPFTVVRKLQADAEANYRTKIKELETSLTDAQSKLNELQRAKGEQAGQKFILSPEQQAEIANFRKKEGEVKVQLKTERKKLRADIDSLEYRVKWLNIAGMPIVVAIVGVGLALARRNQRAAR